MNKKYYSKDDTISWMFYRVPNTPLNSFVNPQWGNGKKDVELKQFLCFIKYYYSKKNK